ncbi:HD family phosphohydrolase [Halotia branconii]|uniref:HD family phosphohydrolase n=1 Tax=Halotia branconii CENA392 TaxID=1539056 RepID=A0AAJ6NRZ2_9CYAN|nr:HD family phosphohydrolase [Halotia branconii]WGV25517.1 HD family phosphohydrolase [Halotia branconii CENA392]
MKTQRFLQSLTQQLSHWRRRYKALRRKSQLLVKVRSQSSKSRRQRFFRSVISDILLYLIKITANKKHRKRKIVLGSMAKSVKQRRGINTVILDWVHQKRFSVVLAIAVLSLTGIIGHKLYNQPQLQVDTIAPQTIRAPYTATIEDRRETEAQRKAVSGSYIPVLIVDTQITEKTDQNLQQLLNEGNEIRAAAGSFPFFDTSVLSISTQHYLRSCSVSEWQTLLLAIENNSKQKSGLSVPKHQSDFSAPYSPLATQKTDFTQALAELEAYRLKTSEQNLSSLIAQISQSREAYAQASVQLLQLETNNSDTVYNNTVLLDLSDDEWAKTQAGIRQSAERILAQGIPSGLLPSILQNAVSLQVQTFVPKNAESLASKLLLAVLQPNLRKDEEQTKQQAKQAADEVTPVMIKVRQGQVIVAKGKNITAWHFEVLEHYQLIRRQNNWLGLAKLAAVVTAAIGIYVWVEKQIKYQLRQRDRLLVLLLALSTPGVLALGIPYTTWSAVGLLLGSFYGPTLGVTVVGLLLLLLCMNSEISMIALLAGAAGGILGSCIAQKLRSREELALLGLAIAVTQGIIYLIAKVLIGAVFSAGWYIVLQETGFFALSGLIWSIVALGLSPYLEKLFDLVTPIRLAELANPNRPLLKRLATETPGTFQHTLFVSTLAEAAAKKLGCNVELVRAGTLYHDIGKMHDPLSFIENQMGGPNKHETEINDPWKSAAVIKKHVTEGLVMARKQLLPTAIQAFIPEHQGTMLIAYFHHQAQQMAEADPSLIVDEAEFRYDGPIPQSRETGIVMLADSCEAALRSLKDATPEQALSMLNNILRARWQDNQMIDSGLTRAEMSEIAQIFVEVWQQFHHKRIAYPKLKASNEKLAQG